MPVRYRITPHSTTGMSPAELLLGHRPRSRLDLLKPFTADRVEDKQLVQKQQHDRKARKRSFRLETLCSCVTPLEVRDG